jgi:hypothetical protein
MLRFLPKITFPEINRVNNIITVGHTPRVLMQGKKKSRRRTPTRILLYSYKDSLCVILLGLLPCNRLETRPLDYIKEGRVPSQTFTIPPGNYTQAQGAILLQTGRSVATLTIRTCINLVSCVLAQTFGFQIMAILTFYLAAGNSHGGREV